MRMSRQKEKEGRKEKEAQHLCSRRYLWTVAAVMKEKEKEKEKRERAPICAARGVAGVNGTIIARRKKEGRKEEKKACMTSTGGRRHTSVSQRHIIGSVVLYLI